MDAFVLKIALGETLRGSYSSDELQGFGYRLILQEDQAAGMSYCTTTFNRYFNSERCLAN